MQRKKECVAMLLAGGQGSRLYALTNKIAKPAVAFGAKYRIIDFPLSNCINSGIDTVGVLTQYEPLELNEYIGNGQPWDLDRAYGGVHILSPYQAKVKSSWYEGTANAIYQNMHFMKKYNPDYVLILSGDHIYKMDYAKMLKAHIETGADCTIAAIEVSLKEASRFGILNTNDDGSIYEFEEKPKQPKSTLASMGIYIFTAEKMYKYLEADENDPDSSKDFGKNILPSMLAAGEKMFAYRFEGYWKDVFFVREGDYYILEQLNSNTFYLPDKNGQLHAVWDRAYPVESAFNVMLCPEVESKFILECQLMKFGNKQEDFCCPLRQWLSFCLSEGCQPYFGITTLTDRSLSGICIMRNEKYGYNHLLRIRLLLDDFGKSEGTVYAKWHAFIPTGSIKDLYEDLKNLQKHKEE